MRNLRSFILVVMILSTFSIYAQEPLYIGMSTEEFNSKLPGILPNEFKFNENLYLKEKLYDIDGKWSFNFSENILTSANYWGENVLLNEAKFNTWIKSAALIIEDYTKIYGKPIKNEKGTNKYIDRNTNEYNNSIGKREVFYETIWETKTMQIIISCDYRSNYYEEFKENVINGPNEWFNYYFQINFSTLPVLRNDNNKEPGKFYLTMNVNDFAKVFPSLFPNGIGMTGQWGRQFELYGLDGSWSYSFKNGKLNWMHYQKYKNEINESNFNKCLSATEQLIKDYTKYYGKPDTTIVGNKIFVDPLVKHHWGYNVLEARWNNVNGQKIKVEFDFMGGKGEYSFVVIINFFDKDYPYFD